MRFLSSRFLLALCFLFFLQFTVCVLTAQESRHRFEIDPWAFDRGIFAVHLDRWRNGGPIFIGHNSDAGGQLMYVEYDIPFPVAGKYQFSVLLAMMYVRPLSVFLNGEPIGTICTGSKLSTSWDSIDAIWDDPIEFNIAEPGIHTIRILATAAGAPHIAMLRFDSEQPFPGDWKLERPHARGLPPPPPPPPFSTAHVAYIVPNAELPNPAAIRRAINDLIETFRTEYPRGAEYLAELDQLDARQAPLEEYDKLRRQALLYDNPYIDFERVLFIRRHKRGGNLVFPWHWEHDLAPVGTRNTFALPLNWESNSSLPRGGYDDEIMTLLIKSPNEVPVSLYKPPRDTAITDLDLHSDADRLMFSAIGDNNRWHLFEIDIDSPEQARQLTQGDPDVDFYDSCYMPDGNIMLTSTASMVGVPCVFGASHVATLFVLDPSTGAMRQIGFDQEHSWNPTMLNNGRILYARWEYVDIPHPNSRLLFHCNPDGSMQLEYYGSNSYWPASIFFARPLPDHPTQIIAVAGGHHDYGRLGELVLFDPAIGRREAEGAIQRIPGWGKKVEGSHAEGLTRNSWPKFVHPFPISQKHFLVAAMPEHGALLGLYLVDIFDNMILLKEMPENALLQPIPFRQRVKPPIIPKRIDLERDDAFIFVSNILEGPGLAGIPPGVVTQLRVYTYHYSYHNTGGLLGIIGQDGPWDIRGVLGTVPVESDGSVHFRTPANLPIAVLPLDESGQALQLMRSWMTPMPGENLHCIGCHEPQNMVPPMFNRVPIAMVKPPAEIKPFNTPNPDAPNLLGQLNVRGFSFRERIQPILDRHCVVCHNGTWEATVTTAMVAGRPIGTALDGKPFPIDLRGDVMIQGWSSAIAGAAIAGMPGGRWSVGYDNLQRFVRRPGIASDYHLLVPMEFAANTTELVQILRVGHHDVKLSEEEWEDLIVWIDMNAPFHGRWVDMVPHEVVENIARRRIELAQLYGAEAIDFEGAIKSWEIMPENGVPQDHKTPENTPFVRPAPSISIEMVAAAQWEPMTIEGIDLVPINYTGRIVRDGDEVIRVDLPFYMGAYEITNAQFRKFNPNHSSGVESRTAFQFGQRGYDVDDDDLPVVRIDWRAAMEFCRWLSEKTGKNVDLPTAAEWEWACRAGTTTPFWYGDFDTDFSPFENLGDRRLKEFVACTAYLGCTAVRIIPNPNPFDDRFPKDERFDDGSFLHVPGGTYFANPWGLFDMHGNVAEFTRTVSMEHSSEITVMGGSWFDRPYRSTSDFKRFYPVHQPVFNTGFRIVVRP